jgi:hypothetical protein
VKGNKSLERTLQNNATFLQRTIKVKKYFVDKSMINRTGLYILFGYWTGKKLLNKTLTYMQVSKLEIKVSNLPEMKPDIHCRLLGMHL